ncbi:peptidoglycan-binding lysin domain-containing protein [Thermincola ferriacetica]|uniref:Peptidoglycan-binding lysin domain-containing protein n=1 Tax=Thermincola ferriacetica TaxID=281456 RepID=A0A0L6W3X9_9FIRM|nr:LysM domain-containing protein [Thermincola ferriacetica]KNZ69794.1 peptidoglycan-binding lysin domain-containing protein [Thermincola ferriacetica]
MYYYPFVRRCPRGTMPYIIKAGDTYYSIALRYNTSVPALIAANPGVNPNFLQIGQTICVPVRPQVPPCPGGNYYTIKPGDTFYSIARRYNISLDDLLAANPGVDPDRLLVGQVICIPVAVPPTECPDGTRPYKIRRGDTFYSIAVRFGISLDALLAANPGVDPDALRVGEQICVPRRRR